MSTSDKNLFEQEAYDYLQQLANDWQLTVSEHEMQWIHQFQEILLPLVQSIDAPPRYLGFVMLRSRLLYNDYFYEIHSYDDEWYLKPYHYLADLPVADFFQIQLDTARAYLETKRKRVMDKVCITDIQHIINKHLTLFTNICNRVLTQAVLTLPRPNTFNDTIIYISELYEEPTIIPKEAD